MGELSPDRVRAKADGLVARINGKGNKHEQDAAALALGKLHAKHHDLFQPAKLSPQAAAQGVAETVQKVRDMAADQNVRVTAAAVKDAAVAATELVGKVADLFGKPR
jgi:hypothetical protein